MSEVNLSAFIYRLLHEDFSSTKEINRWSKYSYLLSTIHMPYAQQFVGGGGRGGG